jgi:hypothetical protein
VRSLSGVLHRTEGDFMPTPWGFPSPAAWDTNKHSAAENIQASLPLYGTLYQWWYRRYVEGRTFPWERSLFGGSDLDMPRLGILNPAELAQASIEVAFGHAVAGIRGAIAAKVLVNLPIAMKVYLWAEKAHSIVNHVTNGVAAVIPFLPDLVAAGREEATRQAILRERGEPPTIMEWLHRAEVAAQPYQQPLPDIWAWNRSYATPAYPLPSQIVFTPHGAAEREQIFSGFSGVGSTLLNDASQSAPAVVRTQGALVAARDVARSVLPSGTGMEMPTFPPLADLPVPSSAPSGVPAVVLLPDTEGVRSFGGTHLDAGVVSASLRHNIPKTFGGQNGSYSTRSQSRSKSRSR